MFKQVPEGFNGSIVVLDTSAIAPFSGALRDQGIILFIFIAERVANQFIEECK